MIPGLAGDSREHTEVEAHLLEVPGLHHHHGVSGISPEMNKFW